MFRRELLMVVLTSACAETALDLEGGAVSCPSYFHWGPATTIESVELLFETEDRPRSLRLKFDASPGGTGAIVAFYTGRLVWKEYDVASRTMVVPMSPGFEGPLTYGSVSSGYDGLRSPRQSGYVIIGDEVRCLDDG